MTTPIDRNSAVPLHLQLERHLLDQIRSEALVPGAQLPPELELGADLGLSRTTVRQAIAALVKRGVLHRVQGRGTFVAPKMEHGGQNLLSSFSEAARAAGRSPGSRVLAIETIEAEGPVAIALAMSGPVQRITRLRLLDAQVIELQTSYVPASYPLSAEAIAQGASLYELLSSMHNVRVVTADEVIDAEPAGTEAALHLGVPVGTALLRIERITYDDLNRPVEFVTRWCRAGESQYRVRLTRT